MTEPEVADATEQNEEPSELELLKGRAKMLGLAFHPKIGVKTLAKKIADFQAKLNKTAAKEEREALRLQANRLQQEAATPPAQKGAPVIPVTETKSQRNVRLRKNAERLIRIRVANMNPQKKDWEGEIYTVSNSVVGTHRKYVPFNADQGWHVPNMIYKHLKERQCQVFYTVKGPRGDKIRKGKQVPELSVEVLPPLTMAEINDLMHTQAMAGNLD